MREMSTAYKTISGEVAKVWTGFSNCLRRFIYGLYVRDLRVPQKRGFLGWLPTFKKNWSY
jgi:hypothetical protein